MNEKTATPPVDRRRRRLLALLGLTPAGALPWPRPPRRARPAHPSRHEAAFYRRGGGRD